MGTSGFQFGWEQAQQARARREAVQDQERQAQLEVIRNAGMTPQLQSDAIRTLYAKDPSALKQHVENLIGRLVGRKPQPNPMAYAPQSTTTQAAPITVGGRTLPAPRSVTVTYPGARTQTERLAQDLSEGRTRQQQAVDLSNAEDGARQDAQLSGHQKLLQWYQTLKPDQQRIAGQILGIAPSPKWADVRLSGGEVVGMDISQGLPPGATLAPTGAAGLQTNPKVIEAGGVPYAVSDPATGQSYYANQMMNPNTPPEVRQVWSTIQTALKQKRDEQQKREDEQNDRQIRSMGAVAARMGQSEQFQEQIAGYRSDLTEYRKVDQQARDDAATAAMYAAQATAPGNKSAFDTALITDYTGILAQGGRKTQAEIAFAQKIGGLGMNVDRMYQRAQNGELPPEMRELYVQYLQTRAQSERAEANAMRPQLPQTDAWRPSAPAPRKSAATGDAAVDNFLRNF